jgi:uncharacterized membrane protein YdjX (TVP38/TMEM64 family)
MKSNSTPGLRSAAAAALLLLAVVGAAIAFSTFEIDLSIEGTTQQIRDWGMWGVAGSIGLMVLHSFLPFPGEIIACANGMVYGALWGAVITWVGAMLGAAVAFALVRWLGRPFVERMVPASRWERMSLWSQDRGPTVLLVARLIPVIAFNLINYVAALTGISWWSFLWATGLGILPLVILMSVLGARMLTLPLWAWALLGVLAIASSLALHRRRGAIQGAMQGSDGAQRASNDNASER